MATAVPLDRRSAVLAQRVRSALSGGGAARRAPERKDQHERGCAAAAPSYAAFWLARARPFRTGTFIGGALGVAGVPRSSSSSSEIQDHLDGRLSSARVRAQRLAGSVLDVVAQLLGLVEVLELLERVLFDCRMRSRVTANVRPTSSSVHGRSLPTP